MRLADLPTLARLGVDTVCYADRDYRRTQDVADAAYFLGFDGLVAPSARWRCLNAVLFTDRVAPDAVHIRGTSTAPIDWTEWRKRKG